MTIVPKPDLDPQYRADLLGYFQRAMDRRNVRGRQKVIGPSEIGGCLRGIAWKLHYGADDGKSQGWASHKGTLLHEWADEEVFDPEERFLSDLKLPQVVPWVDGGTLDLYDTWRNTIIDFKFDLWTSTEVATPYGWSTIGDIQIGQMVFDRDGQPCTVVDKTPVFTDSECYRVTFDDRSSLVAGGNHLWPVDYGYDHRQGVLTTNQIKARLERVGPRSGKKYQGDVRVPNPSALELPEVDLPIAPYLLGVWLGDGFNSGDRICQAPADAQEIFDSIESFGYTTTFVADLERASLEIRRVEGLRAGLVCAGLDFGRGQHGSDLFEKRIPGEYMRASRRQRLELLQGLMDTDGTWNKLRNQAVFAQKDESLARQVAELVSSLGWKVRAFSHKTQWEWGGGLRSGFAVQVVFVPDGRDNPFKLTRKANLVRATGSKRSRFRVVRSVERVPSIPTQCITVDSPSSTFLAGREMIPTHNCGDASMAKARSGKPPEGYYVQANAYGIGAIKAGLKVERVALLYGPMCGDDLHGTAKGATLLTWPFDPQVAVDHYKEVKRVQDMLAVAPVDDVMRILPTKEDFCHTRPCNTMNKDPRAICGGHRKSGAKLRNPDNPFDV